MFGAVTFVPSHGRHAAKMTTDSCPHSMPKVAKLLVALVAISQESLKPYLTAFAITNKRQEPKQLKTQLKLHL